MILVIAVRYSFNKFTVSIGERPSANVVKPSISEKNTERILKEIHENEKSVLSQINTLAENDMRLSLMISDIYEKVRNNKN